ncbi:DUF1569 domain-containing protein [Aureisphaera galaxeae]|uniref:DUF1569 domain-containing protein n=1 Tax=Aureisphaera galaxeae TaxID=1538023 RepID=UPI002350029D|nr:DUF1569 domain-containing protein [Aureisphaera galaxeae]MDC8002721.1 DUF1569 domain-containing protein [Aureisphaera galaxeae]
MWKKITLAVLLLIVLFAIYSKFAMNTTNPNFLDDHFAELEAKISSRDVQNEDVSKVPVAWHLDHSLKTINGIYDSLEASNPEDFDSSFSAIRTMSLTMNFIPRGRAESPASVRPPEVIETEALYAQLTQARENMKKVFELDENVHFEHPVFGTIARGNTLRFLEVHTEHHLKIMRDILGE